MTKKFIHPKNGRYAVHNSTRPGGEDDYEMYSQAGYKITLEHPCRGLTPTEQHLLDLGFEKQLDKYEEIARQIAHHTLTDDDTRSEEYVIAEILRKHFPEDDLSKKINDGLDKHFAD